MRTPKVSKLSDYIDEYMKNRGSSSSKEIKSFSSWNTENGDTSLVEADRALVDARSELLRSQSGYGKNAEALASRGLMGSGYAKYLDSLALERYGEARAYVDTHKLALDSAAVKGYAEYLDEMQKQRRVIYYNAERELLKLTTPDYETAYARAVELGLTPDEATELATNTTARIRQKLMSSASKTVIENALTENQAREYALSIGLSALDADELARLAAKINEKADFIVGEEEPEEKISEKESYILPGYSDFIKKNIIAQLK